jgi:hypothetical protein
LYESDLTPSFEFLYKKDDVASIQQGTVANSLTCTDIAISESNPEKNLIRIVNLGKQSSITSACKTMEQAIGFSVGGYTAVTPIVRTDLDIRVRNYTVQKDGEDLNCTACAMKLGGQYYGVIAVCDDDSLEKVTLAYTLAVMSLSN